MGKANVPMSMGASQTSQGLLPIRTHPRRKTVCGFLPAIVAEGKAEISLAGHGGAGASAKIPASHGWAS